MLMQVKVRIADQPGVSWWHVITDLERLGFFHGQIAGAIGAKRTTVLGWKNREAEPRHEDGERLIALWRVATGRTEEFVPRKPYE
jgi:hypothetical protein